MLDVATAGADGRGRALIVGGGISNFTDVASTFKGIIQVRARDTRCCGLRSRAAAAKCRAARPMLHGQGRFTGW